MNKKTSRWAVNAGSAAYLAAMDIVSFSQRMGDPDALFAIRANLVRAVENTPFFQQALDGGWVWAHFLGR